MTLEPGYAAGLSYEYFPELKVGGLTSDTILR